MKLRLSLFLVLATSAHAAALPPLEYDHPYEGIAGPPPTTEAEIPPVAMSPPGTFNHSAECAAQSAAPVVG